MPSVRDDVQSVLSRYTFAGPLKVFAPRVSTASGAPYPRRGGRVHCRVSLTVPERETGEPYEVSTSFVVIHGSPEEAVHRSLLQAVLDRLRHEVLESVRFDGELVADPHVSASWQKFVGGG